MKVLADFGDFQVVESKLCNVNYDDSHEREWNEPKSDMEEFELDEDLKETKEGK